MADPKQSQPQSNQPKQSYFVRKNFKHGKKPDFMHLKVGDKLDSSEDLSALVKAGFLVSQKDADANDISSMEKKIAMQQAVLADLVAKSNAQKKKLQDSENPSAS